MSGIDYRGIIPPLVTPLKAGDLLDEEGLERLIEHVLAGGVQGIFLLGTTGEGPSLSYKLRRHAISEAGRIIDRRVPLLVGISDTSFEESLGLAGVAADEGADAVVFTPPYYYAADQAELMEYTQKMAGRLPLPFFLYNMPGLTKISFETGILRESLEMKGCLGLKDSSGNLLYFKRAVRLARRHPHYRILMGPEELLAEALLAGGHGGVSGGANLFPRLYVNLYRAAERGDYTEAARLQRMVLEVSSHLYCIGSYGSSIIKGIKCALSCLGICSDVLAEPYSRFHPAERQRVEKALAELARILPENSLTALPAAA